MNLDELKIIDPIVPDSIQPFKGYKALTIALDGTLWSPSESMQWPVRKRLEAQCTRGLSNWGWVPVDGPARKLDETTLVSPATNLFSSSRPVTAMSSTAIPTRPASRPPMPSNPLPPGWNWSWEPHTHDAPAEGCGCGIYAVSQPANCLGYVKPDGVIVEVAVWGNVVPASNGVRGQYAYPQSILAPAEIVDELKVTAELYGIPIVVLDAPKPGSLVHFGIDVAKVTQAAQPLAELGEPIDVTNMGDPVKKTIAGPPPIQEDPVFKALKEAAQKAFGKEKP